MRSRFLGLGLAAAVFAGTVACDEDLSSLTGPTPNLTPTFSSVQTEIFNTTDAAGRTSCISCHNSNGRVPAGGLDLTSPGSYARLVNVPSGQRSTIQRVTPGDPENSYIIHKLEGRPGIVGGRMPRGTGPFLTDGQMLVLRRWIELGAQNN